jgi:hypothetical protein
MIVYRHIRLDKNEPFYIGIGSKTSRAFSKDSRNPLWKRVVKKTKYRVDILFDDLTKEEACEKEKEFISLYGRKNLGTGTLCNLTAGGDGTVDIVITEETKKMWREQRKGSGNSMYGKTHTDSTKKKISITNKGRKMTEEQVAAMSERAKGRVFKESSKEKLSIMRNALVESLCYNGQIPLINDETGDVIQSIKKFCKKFNMPSSTAKRRINNGWVEKSFGYRKMTEEEIQALKSI